MFDINLIVLGHLYVTDEKLYLFLTVGALETVHSVDTATLGGLGGISLYVFSTVTSFKESLFFLLRFGPFIIKNIHVL